jgi:hypothetical protein
MSTDQQTFADHRSLLFAIAYRILGTAADAEDVVQDAWFKWSAANRGRVVDPKAYLGRIVSNLSMDRLQVSERQRETYVGPWLPEPILTTPTVDIADMAAEVVDINGGPGIVFTGAGRVIATLTVDLDGDGRIATIHNVANPDKLGAIADGVARM